MLTSLRSREDGLTPRLHCLICEVQGKGSSDLWLARPHGEQSSGRAWMQLHHTYGYVLGLAHLQQ